MTVSITVEKNCRSVWGSILQKYGGKNNFPQPFVLEVT